MAILSLLHITLSHHTVTSHCHIALSHRTVTSHCHTTSYCHIVTRHRTVALSHHIITPSHYTVAPIHLASSLISGIILSHFLIEPISILCCYWCFAADYKWLYYSGSARACSATVPEGLGPLSIADSWSQEKWQDKRLQDTDELLGCFQFML